MKSPAQRRDQLQARFDALKDRLLRIETELDSHHTKDWEDLAVEREPDEVLQDLGVAGQLEMRQIEVAFDRISAGEYGVCTKCGEVISEERLDLLPHTPFCRNCAT